MTRSSKVAWSSVALGLLLTLAAVLASAKRTQAHHQRTFPVTTGSTPALPAVRPPADPYPHLGLDIRPLVFEPLPAAVELYRQVTAEPLVADRRRQLADLYGKSRYAAVGQFFRLTADFLLGRAIPPLARPKVLQYECSDISLPGKPDYKVAQDMGMDVAHLRIFDALQRGQRYLEQEGWSCQVAYQWADTLMMLPIMTQEDWTTREMQVRFYITGAVEAGQRPAVFGGPSDATCWQRLSIYFDRMNDLPSAYVAEILHQRSLEEDPSCREDDCLKGPIGQDITRRLRSLRAMLDKR